MSMLPGNLYAREHAQREAASTERVDALAQFLLGEERPGIDWEVRTDGFKEQYRDRARAIIRHLEAGDA